MENDRYVFCPLVDEKIEDIDCIENRNVVDGMIVDESLPAKYKQKGCGKISVRNANGMITINRF